MIASGMVYYFPLIVANPNSYAKTYADSNHVSFSCIEHSDNLVYRESIAPTYSTVGRNAGYFCSVCGTAVSGGEVIPPLKHEPITIMIIPEKGSTVTVSNSTYKITNSSTKNCTVEYSKTKSTKKNLTIPSTVNINGIKCKVTSIAKNVFKKNKKIKRVTIGNNVTKINANAFKGCKNLKTIIIKSKKLKYIGKNAFKGINSKAKIKVPAKKLKAYKRLFKKKGLKPTVKIVKI